MSHELGAPEEQNPYESPMSASAESGHHGKPAKMPDSDSGRLPPWEQSTLPDPPPLSWRNWASFIGPGIVMMGIQIGGGEWLLGPTVTLKYGGGLMWLATVAIVLQVFYNIECGRYALYCGEPVFTGFMRCRPSPLFWVGLMLFLNMSALIPGLSTHGAAMIASLILDRPAGPDDKFLVTMLSYACLAGVALPVLLGGKIYDLLQNVMTVKVVVVLGFCLILGVTCVHWTNWWSVFSGFVQFGNVPVAKPDGSEGLANVFTYFAQHGSWPEISTASLIALGAFAGYAGGGGLSNSTYSNFVRDKGWGMGSRVGAIASALGTRSISLSHVGKVFEISEENLSKWKGWWRYILTDQVLVWGPGCFMGMALPALLSMQFAGHTTIPESHMSVAQSLVTADGLRHYFSSPMIAKLMWIAAILTGMMVMFPSQMSVFDDFSRRWTDAIWSANQTVRKSMKPNQIGWLYFSILATYCVWSFFCAFMFSNVPQLMTNFIANSNNVAIGLTSFQLLYINHKLLPQQLRPKWYQSVGVFLCGVFYVGLSAMVFYFKILPMLFAALSTGK